MTATAKPVPWPRALTIAGSDSGGGAGIQADLKTFAALNVHGMSAITAITAQNTVEVRAVHDVPVEVIKAQIEAVIDDIGIDAAKTGMLHTGEIIAIVAEELGKHRIPTVVDPVMIAKSGAILLQDTAVDVLKKKLFPIATVVTPNTKEAEVLAQMKIKRVDDSKAAAKKILEYGSRAVVVKGGHIAKEHRVVDVLYFEGGYKEYAAPFIERNTDHGTGCSFSAAITAGLAKGRTIPEAVDVARKIISSAIRHGVQVGKGHGPVNPMATLYRDAEKFTVLKDLEESIRMLEESQLISRLIPESQSNIAVSLQDPESPADVAAIPGRIVRIGRRVKASASPEFGVSGHVAAAVLTAMRFDSSVRAGMNIAYSPSLVKVCESLGLTVSYYDRSEEPADVKSREGGSIPWGTEQAISRIHRVPDVFYHAGDYGKEPMAVVLGTSAIDVTKKTLRIAEALARAQI